MKRQEQKELTRKKLFHTSITLFLENGYEQVSIDSIVKSAGLTKGAFYHHFISKDAILVEYSHQIIDHLNNRIFAVIKENTHKNSKEILEDIFEQLVVFYLSHFDPLKLLMDETIKVQTKFNEILKNEITIIIDRVLQKGIQEKEFELPLSTLKVASYISVLIAEEFKSSKEIDFQTLEQKENISKEFRDILAFALGGLPN